MSRKSVSLFAAAAIAAALMAPAAAAQTAEPRSITVYYGDLNLSRADGINTLTGRLDRALDKAGVRNELKIYPEADHDFYVKGDPARTDAIATEAMNMMVAWFEKELKK